MEFKLLTPEEIKVLKQDPLAYKRYLSSKVYHTNKESRERKLQRMREYYIEHKEAINSKYKEYKKEYNRLKRAKQKLERENLNLS